jgi:D-alanyl-lipoteichoic acid acyltransferase DltB (MBOAT superfamily)
MLFNSYTFLLLFLPVAVIVFQLLRGSGAPLRVAMGWLVLMSLLYYGWWNPDPSKPWSPLYLGLIVGSCFANYFFGSFLSRHRGSRGGKAMLAAGVIANLALLGYYKYAGLFAKTLAALTGEDVPLPDIILPLGISFFTFQQVAYLVDAYRGETEEYHITDYFLFVTFFPQLIAGPIVHHREVMPQLQRPVSPTRRSIDLSVGISLFAMGLFKKVVIADNLTKVANPLFGAVAAAGGRDLTIVEAWAAAVAYSLQLYFDFSGYSDMAIGAARMFGIVLPVNFHSPYKATSIVDFWRRWHITLSRFLRDYVYFALGGNRKGPILRYSNLLVTMLLGGLWHGAGWTYLLWGGMHGLFLCANHGWFALRKKFSLRALPKPLAIGLTFIVVVAAWVPFRAGAFELGDTGTTSQALRVTRSILASMFGLNGFDAWPNAAASEVKESWGMRALYCIALVWLLPNSQQVMRRYFPAMGLRGLTGRSATPGPRHWWQWRPTWQWTAFIVVLVLGSIYEFDKVSEFIYFQF